MESPILQPINTNRGPKFREVAYGMLKDAILAGRIRPDQPLTEEQLADQLNISRTPVREALAILEHEGLIGAREGQARGLYLKLMTRQQFVECLIAGEVVEADLARRAARLADDELVQAMSETIERAMQEAQRESLALFLREGREFLRLLGLASENAPLAEFFIRNQERIDLFLLLSGSCMSSAEKQASARQYQAILNAILRRDPDEAGRMVAVRAQAVRMLWSAWLQDDQDQED